MKTAAIICEYNPFHNGHLYQIETIRERFGEDCAIVAIMSGHFVQRGEAALLDKWSRTRAALRCGVNLVIELPAAYATGSAERFADGGVALAAACGLCDTLVFGSEEGDLGSLDALAEILAFEPDCYRQNLKENLDTGLSFPVSRVKALEACAPDLRAEAILGASNNILAVEYLKALKRRRILTPKPYTIKREGQDYRQSLLESADGGTPGFPSAAAIRASLIRADSSGRVPGFGGALPYSAAAPSAPRFADIVDALLPAMPEASLAVLADRLRRGECIVSQEVFAPLFFAFLRSHSAEDLARIPGMNEGLAERLREGAGKTRDSRSPLSGLISETATKRYPQARVRRALTHMALGLEMEDFELFDRKNGPFYLRILGFDKKGRYLLKKMRTCASLPILTKGSDFLEYANNPENKAMRRMAELDCIATDLWMSAVGKGPGRDFTMPPETPGIPAANA